MSKGTVVLNPVQTYPLPEDADAFSRQRVSEPTTLFSAKFTNNKQPQRWNELAIGQDSEAEYLQDESSILLRCGTEETARVVRQSKRYINYEPGKSQLVYLTGVLGEQKQGVIKRLGLYEDNNGLFFELSENGMAVVIRSSTSGNKVDTKTAQQDWNIDSMDGTGPSGIDLDPTKVQLFMIDFQWLGVGQVRFGFVHEGQIHFVHKANFTNNADTVYMGTPDLPVRYEVENTETVATVTDDFKQICSAVISEGGVQDTRVTFYTATTEERDVVVSIQPGEERPILSIRPKEIFNEKVNRTLIMPKTVQIITGDGSLFWSIQLNSTLIPRTNIELEWDEVDEASATEVNVNAIDYETGFPISAGFISGSRLEAGVWEQDINIQSPIARGIEPSTFDSLTLIVRKLGGNQPTQAHAAFKWEES